MSQFFLATQRPPFHVPIAYQGWRLDANGGGAGSLGIVKKFDGPDGRSIAIKKYTAPYESAERTQLIQRELDLLRNITHPNIVRLMDSYDVNEGKELYHITEYCGVPLRKVIEEGNYSIAHVKKWIRELLMAVQHLHANGVIHRNLHPDNMCIDANHKLTLLGFGKARVITRNQNMTAERGTQPYMPIEMLLDWSGAYDEKVDIWSIATLLCELITGQPLFSAEQVNNSLKLQIQYCGCLEENVLDKIVSEMDRKYIGEYSRKCERKDFIQFLRDTLKARRGIRDADTLANEEPLRDFIENTLQMDPDNRKYDSPDGQSSIVVKKCMKPFESPDRAKKLLRQLNLLRTIKHENIVSLIGSYIVPEETEDSIYVITEYYGEPMSEWIERGDYTMRDVKRWTREMLKAVQYLHSNGVIHSNLRPGNICIDNTNKLTVIDFGKPRSIIYNKKEMNAKRGVNQYSPIELIVEMDLYDEKVDIWSIGVLLFDLITGFPLFDEKNPLNQQLEFCGPVTDSGMFKMKNNSDRAHFEDILVSNAYERADFIQLMLENLKETTGRGITDDDIVENADNLRDFIDRTLQYDSERRMSTSQALSHPFLRTAQPWEDENETIAENVIRSKIRDEIEMTHNLFSLPERINEEYIQVDEKEYVGKLFRVRRFIRRDRRKSIIIKKCTNYLQSKGRAKLLLRHLNLLRTIEHDNIVGLIGSYSRMEMLGGKAVKSVYTITEYCGERMSKRIERGDYSMEDVKNWMREMLRAVQHLHSNGVIHRKLHPGNICIDENNTLFLIAFGHARVIDLDQNMTVLRGTNPYSPIELQVNWVGPYDEKVDIWNIAALLCDLLTGKPLFSDGKESTIHPLTKQLQYCGGMTPQLIARNFIDLLCSNMMEGRSIIKEDILEDATNLRDFLDNTLVFDADRRMSAKRALAHPFLSSPQLVVVQLPSDEEALNTLDERIDEEIDLAPYEE